MIRALLVVPVLLVFPAAVAAGPIPWTYQSEFGGAAGGSTLLLSKSLGTGWYAGTAHAWGSGGWENSGYRFGIGYVYFGQLGQNPWPPPNGAEDTYRAAFTLTDAASGASARVVMTGSSLYQNFGWQTVTQDFTLGSHDYRITLLEERQPATIAVFANVGISTPEPGTLALGAMGLLSIGLAAGRRFRHRKAA
jgi:hypothetical protein